MPISYRFQDINPLNNLLFELINLIIVAFLENATIGYSLESLSVCVCVCVYVCVCVCVFAR